jgi:hypothetical protein
VKWTEVVSCGERLVSGISSRQRFVGEQSDDSVEGPVALLDAGEMSLEHLAARHLLAPDAVREFQCTELPQLCHGPIMAHT